MGASAESRQAQDTAPEIARLIIEGYRRMTPAEKLRRVFDINRSLEQLAAARIRAQRVDIPERELQLRLASLRLDAETMRPLRLGSGRRRVLRCR